MSDNRGIGVLNWVIMAVVFSMILFKWPATGHAATVDRSKPNVYKGGSWSLGNTGVKEVTKDGRPALEVPTREVGVIFRSPAFAVKPNKLYTCVIDFRGDVWPSTSIRFSISFFKGSTHLGNSKTASGWMYKKDEVGKWREAPNVFKTPGNANKALVLMSRVEDSNMSNPTFLSKAVYCHEGNFWKGNPDPKRPFDGSFIKVSANGVFAIDGKPTFLRCAYPDNNNPRKDSRWPQLVKAGFNCNMWVASLKALQSSVKHGMKYNFLTISPAYHKKSRPPQQGWAYGNLGWVEKTVKSILNSPQSKNLVGYL